MVIADLVSHEREDLRRRFAHARLGFTDRAVLDWLGAHGLVARVVAHLAGELTISVWAATRPMAPAQHAGLRSVG